MSYSVQTCFLVRGKVGRGQRWEKVSFHAHFVCFVTFGSNFVGYIYHYYAHEWCIKDEEGAKSVKQSYIIVLLIYTSDCKAVLAGLYRIHCVLLMHFSFTCAMFRFKKNAIKKGKWLILAQTVEKILLVIHNAVVV